MKKLGIFLGLNVVAFNLFSTHDSGFKNLHCNASPFNILLQACIKGDLNQAASIIPSVKNLNKQMNNKKTTFVKTQLVKLYGINAQSKIQHKMTPLVLASSRGHKDIVKLLIGYGVDVNIQTEQRLSALMVAAESGDAEMVKILLKHKANPNLQKENGCTALMIATSKGYKKIVELLLISKADPHIKGVKEYSALMFAAEQGREEIAELLLQHGAKPDLQRENGCTALIGASFQGRKEIVELLLQHGANPDLQEKDGRTALIIASYKGYKKIVELLLQHGAIPDLQEENGRTALMRAAQAGHLEIVELLLKYCANPNVQDEQGITALMVALFPDIKSREQEKKVIETIECLLGYNADTQLKLRGRSDTINEVLNNAKGIYGFRLKSETVEELKMIIQSTYDLQKDGARNALIKYPHFKELLIKRMLKQGAQLYTNKAIQEAFSSELIDDKELIYKEGLEYIHNNYLSDLGKIYKNDYFKKQAVSQSCFEKYTAREYYFNNLKTMSKRGTLSDIVVVTRDN